MKIVAINLLGDSKAELVSCNEDTAWAVSRVGSSYTPLWFSAPARCKAITAGDREGDGQAEVIVGTYGYSNGYSVVIPAELRVFDPRRLAGPIASVQLPGSSSVNDLAFGDPDHDGHMEIVAVTDDAAYIFDAKTLALEHTFPGHGGRQVFISNIDDDGRIEVVVNGDTGRVLDFYDRVQKWGYVGGFGRYLDVRNVDADPEAELVFVNGYYAVTILEGDTFATTNIPMGQYDGIDAVTAGDFNGDGTVEIVTGNNQHGDIRAFRISDGAKLWSFRNESSTSAITSGELDGDPTPELLWKSGSVFIGGTGGVEWSSATNRVIQASRIADLDGDGRPEQVVALAGPTLQVLDARTKLVKGTLATPQAPVLSTASRILTAQLDNDPALEIAVQGSESHDLYIWVFDGTTYQFQWATPKPASYDAPRIYGTLTIGNVDADPIEEIVLGMTDDKVYVLNGASSIVQWTSPKLTLGRPQAVAVGDIDGSGAADLIVATWSGFHIFDAATWTERRAIAFSGGATSVAATDGQFAVGGYSAGVRVYDGTTLNLLWNCTEPNSDHVVYANIAGRKRLATRGPAGKVLLFPTTGNSCPQVETLAIGPQEASHMQFVDVTGDGRVELSAIYGGRVWELDLLGWADEPRGDMNGDGVVTDADIDALIAYLLGGAPGAPPGADVNADGQIALDDAFFLIDYRRGTGAAPPQQ